MFLDETTITVHGGKGGKGCVSWRREKYIPKGGPDGGDGGDGGSIFLTADPNTDTLSGFAEVKVFKAPKGDDGQGKKMAGRKGEDLMLRVPPGTIVRDAETSETLADLAEKGASVRIARGGRGGYGNAHFTSSVRQAPDFAELGEPGEERRLALELKLVADVGIIGLPSAGKSTLISVISAARPKIGDYPFTTLVPNLGVVTLHERPSRRAESGRSIVVCDVPGLIEGASEGKGLGDKFLRHIERCGVLVHLLDLSHEDIVADYRAIRRELEKFSPTLALKRELVVLNKIDLVNDDFGIFAEELRKNGIALFAAISAVSRHGLVEFLDKLLPIVLEEREKRRSAAAASAAEDEARIPTLQPHLVSERTDAFAVTEKPEGIFTVEGKRIEQIAAMTDWRNPGAITRFRDIAERTGLTRALRGAKAAAGSTVRIGSLDVTNFWDGETFMVPGGEPW